MTANSATVSVAARRIAANAGGDAIVGAVACLAAIYLANPAAPAPNPWALLWAAVAVLLAGLPFGLSTQYWRFAGSAELLAVAAASALAAALTTLVLQVARVKLPSAAFPVIDALCLCVLLSGSRAAYRFLRGGTRDATIGRPVLLIGTGAEADLFLRAIDIDFEAGLRAIGLLSLGDGQTGRRIHGCPILGPIGGAEAVLDRLPDLDLIVVTAPELHGGQLSALLALARARGIHISRAPSLTALGPPLQEQIFDDASA